jgi:TRAP-type mannitol/chloroaromatic compound transport system permease small subunit
MQLMNRWMALARGIDALNLVVGRAASWLVLVAVLISAGNAVVRKAFDISSNAWLELQWYLFAAMFLLCGAYTLLKQAHVRIDLVYARWSRRTQIRIDIVGTLFFLLPMALVSLWLTWHVFLVSFQSGEQSANAGGLPLWPAKVLMPIGFALLALQGVAEIIKRVAFLYDVAPDPVLAHAAPSEAEMIAEAAAAAGVKLPEESR